MNKKKRTIIVLHTHGENDAINFGMRTIAEYCRSASFNIEYFDMDNFSQDTSTKFIQLIESEDIAYCMTWCGIGQKMEVQSPDGTSSNVWEYFDIPMLKFQGDSPALYMERHSDTPKNSVNIYGYEEHLDFCKLVLQKNESISTMFDPLLYYDVPENDIDFRAREQGKLYFLKNGRNPASMQRYWREHFAAGMAKQLRDLSCEVLSIGLKPGKIRLDQVVLDFFDELKIDLRCNWPLLCFYAAQMDDYLRREKATMVAKALLSFPVVIQGNGWEYLEASGAVAEIAPAQDPRFTEEIYRTQLGIIDMSPNVDTGAHDRMCRAAGTYSFALTNKTTWLNNLLPELNAAAYEFHPDQIQSSVNDVLKDPASHIELGRQYGRVFRARYDTHAFVERLSTIADMARVRDARPQGCNPV